MPAPKIPAMTSEQQAMLAKAWKTWEQKTSKNELLSAYRDGHRAFRDLGISIPPQMRHTQAALGWAGKAVEAHARKHIFEGYQLAGSPDPYEIGETLTRSSFDTELAQAIEGTYTHSCSFLVISQGDMGAGEAPLMITARDARYTAGVWDRRRRELAAALAITEMSDDGAGAGVIGPIVPKAATLYLRDSIWLLERASGSRWRATALPNPIGQVLAEVLPHSPSLSRPFGRSLISREVRYLNDAGVRTLVRAETSAEFYSSPQRWVVGTDEERFKTQEGRARWSAVLGRVLALEPNADGNLPQVGQFAQMSMSPHLEMYRQLAQNFCAATSIPMSTVGIFADNPASAEAMQAAEHALAEDVEYQWRNFAPALRRIIEKAVMIRDGLTAPPKDSWKLQVSWTPARYVSPQAAADSAVKLVSAFPQLAGTRVALSRAGLTATEIEQVQSQQARASALETLTRLAAPEGGDG